MDTKALRQKILDLAIRGKLVPQDPNDEPASVLLERIRAEKQQMVKDGKLKPKDIKNDTVIFKGDDNLHYEKYGEPLPDGWAVTNFGTLLSYEQPTKYIVNNTNYKPTYKTPVLTAGKSFILGYTDETDDIFDDLPVIIFDDFTTESKYVDFAFKVKSSAMKILHINQELVLPKYAFFLMQATEIDHDNHQRYWISTYSQEIISLPPLSEQIKIIEAIENLFELVQSVDNNIQNLKNAIKSVKSKILDLAIRGKLVPQNPNDEPASVLLERIRAEKEELIKQGKIKRNKKESVIFKGDDNSYYEKIGNDVTCIDDEIPFETPTNWQWVRLGSTVGIERGGSPRPIKSYITADSDGINWIKIGDVDKDGKYITNTKEKIKPTGIKKSREVYPGDFLLTNSMSFGRPYISKIYGCVHDGWLVLRNPDAVFDINFLYYLLSSNYLYNQFVIKASGSTVDNLNIDKVSSALICLPPLKEQTMIVNQIEKIIRLIQPFEELL